MTRTWASAAVWTFAILAVVLGVAAFAVPPATRQRGELLLYLLFALTFATTGAVIALRQPRNAVGWLFLAVAVGAALGSFSWSYATYGLFAQPGLPAATFAAWLYSWIVIGGVATMPTILPLIFPTGRPPSPRWRVLLRAETSVIALMLVLLAFGNERITLSWEDGYVIPNPYVLGRIPGLQLLANLTIALWALLVFTSAASMISRYIRARAIERQQIKWFVFAAGVSAIGVPVAFFVWDVGSFVFYTGALALPIAAAIAILRYRLYEIDVVIRRTLVYGAVSLVLAATYFAAVVLLQAALRPLTSGSELAVAGSTLLVVALFQPLRSRIQDAVDARFFRSRYDAARTIDTFSTHMRDEVDLEAVRRELLGAVGETMRPAHVSVWLREGRG